MSERELFYARRRLKELRAVIRRTNDFNHDGPVHDEVVALLRDLADDLASRADAGRDDAFHFIIRCMGSIAENHAPDAYEPYGFVNPFGGLTESEPDVPLWRWPVILVPPAGGAGAFFGTFREYSALKMFGYTVGKNKESWSQPEREAFLADFMEMALPPIVEATFGDEYGAPMSADRLRKVANLIASLARNALRRNPVSNAVAIAHWESDLAFLKREFYFGAGLAFEPWPSSRPD